MRYIDIIIVNWNSGEQLHRCLSSIATYGANQINKVVIVDNNSSDESLKYIKCFSLPLEIIKNQRNIGFAAACNQGAAICSAKYLLFLNPDTKLFPGSLSVPLAFMESDNNKQVGICGIQLVRKDGTIARTCARFPTLWRFLAESSGISRIPIFGYTGMHMKEWDHANSQPVDQVIGAFFFVRRALFERLHGFDESFFVYFEEVDFSYRANINGWSSWYLTEAKAFHEGGGTSRQVKDKRLFYSLRSRLLYAFKHLPTWQAILVLFCTLGVEPFTRSLYCALTGNISGIANILKAYKLLLQDFSNIIVSINRTSG